MEVCMVCVTSYVLKDVQGHQDLAPAILFRAVGLKNTGLSGWCDSTKTLSKEGLEGSWEGGSP